MLTKARFALLIVALIAVAPMAHADPALQVFLEQTLVAARDKDHLPAVAALVLINGKIEAEAALGVRAVDVLAEGKGDRMVAWWNRQVIDVPLEKVVGRSRTVDPDGTLIRTARALGICLGDAG